MIAVSTGSGDQYGALKYDRNINTGYIPNLGSFSNAYKKKIIAERNNQGLKLGYGKGSKTGNKLDKLKELKKKNSKLKNKIKALNNKVTNENDEVYDNGKPEDAGDQFGGKQSKKKSKKIDY